MAAADDELRAGDGELRRYEQLRAQRLEHYSGGGALGVALLQRRGICAWARAWQGTAPAPGPDAARGSALPSASGPAPCGGQIVGALAQMALGCLAGS